MLLDNIGTVSYISAQKLLILICALLQRGLTAVLRQFICNCKHPGSSYAIADTQAVHMQLQTLRQFICNYRHPGSSYAIADTQAVHMQLQTLRQFICNCRHSGSSYAIADTLAVHMQLQTTYWCMVPHVLYTTNIVIPQLNITVQY